MLTFSTAGLEQSRSSRSPNRVPCLRPAERRSWKEVCLAAVESGRGGHQRSERPEWRHFSRSGEGLSASLERGASGDYPSSWRFSGVGRKI